MPLIPHLHLSMARLLITLEIAAIVLNVPLQIEHSHYVYGVLWHTLSFSMGRMQNLLYVACEDQGILAGT